MEQKVPEFQQEVAQFRKEYGEEKIGEITVNMVSIYLYLIVYLVL